MWTLCGFRQYVITINIAHIEYGKCTILIWKGVEMRVASVHRSFIYVWFVRSKLLKYKCYELLLFLYTICKIKYNKKIKVMGRFEKKKKEIRKKHN